MDQQPKKHLVTAVTQLGSKAAGKMQHAPGFSLPNYFCTRKTFLCHKKTCGINCRKINNGRVLGRGNISKRSAAKWGPWQALHVEKSTARAEFMPGVAQRGPGIDTRGWCDPVITSGRNKTSQHTSPPLHGDSTSENLLVIQRSLIACFGGNE